MISEYRVAGAGSRIWLIAFALSIMVASTARTAESPSNSTATAQPPFDIWEFRVLGNTRLGGIDVERLLYPMLGAGKTIDDVESARQALESAYRDKGFGTVFVDIPEQQVTGGIVRLHVTEGRLDRVRVTGARYFSNRDIRAAVPALKEDVVPNLTEVQSQIAALNARTADRAVVPVLKAGRTPGTVDVELKVKDGLPLHGNLELNDRYTANTRRLRLNATLSFDNLFQRQQSLSLVYQTAPQDRSAVQAYVGSYVFRLQAVPDTAFVAYAVKSDSDVAALGALSVIGNGKIYGLRAIRTLPGSAGLSHSLSLGIDYKDFLENIRLAADQELVTPIRYINWSVGYSVNQRSKRTTNNFGLTANFGIRGLVNDPKEFEEKRYKGTANYFYLRGSLQQLRQLTDSLQIVGRIAGQVTGSPLVNNEQLSIGGVDTVRGYLESSQLGDYGANGTLEVRGDWLSQPLHLPKGSGYIYAFYDAGVVAIMNALPSQTARFDIASWGIGARIGGWHGFDLTLDGARALKSAGTVTAGDERLHFSAKYGF